MCFSSPYGLPEDPSTPCRTYFYSKNAPCPILPVSSRDYLIHKSSKKEGDEGNDEYSQSLRRVSFGHRNNAEGDNIKGGHTMNEIIFALTFLACLSSDPAPGLKEGPPKCMKTHDLRVIPLELRRQNLECFAKVGENSSVPVKCPWVTK
jgi:hypothetical protein